MISVRQVSKSFGNHTAVHQFSLDVRQGERVVLLGPSGSGKTTVLRMINGLVAPTSGTIMINGRNIIQKHGDELRRHIGYVLQRNSLFPHYTVEENIAVVPHLLKWNKIAIRKRIVELMKKLQLPEEYLSRNPGALSGGEAQRVNIARALAADPPLLLMDEPFSALDTVTRKAIRKQFAQLDELSKKTVVMVSHDIREAFEMATTICLMHQGRLVQKGTPADLLYHPANDFVQDFFANDYLQLSLGITTIADLWHYLPGDVSSEGDSVICMGSGATLWKAMELIDDKNGHKDITVMNTRTGENKRTSWGNLIEAYHSLQHNRRK